MAAADCPDPPMEAAVNLPKPLQFDPSPSNAAAAATAAATLVAQGAEGRLYKTTYLDPTLPCALKHRPPKPYRHPTLDARLTRQRILAEARILHRCRRDGVAVPAVYAVEEGMGCLFVEWVEGGPVRTRLNAWLVDNKVSQGVEVSDADVERIRGSEELKGLMRRVGEAVGKLHAVGVVHGDLTTSNMMLRPLPQGGGPAGEVGQEGKGGGTGGELLDGDIILIDFGLASQSSLVEDRAVDLYVLERAFGSTHPRAADLFDRLLEGYKATFKQAPTVMKKLDDVRMRGRKRSMVG